MKFKRNNKRRIVASVEMTPLIDVVFQLLIFFMLSSTFVVQSSIPIEMLPESEGGVNLEQKEVSISLLPGAGGPDGGGAIHVDSVEIQEWAELSVTLAELAENKPDALVLIRADARVDAGRLVKVLGIASKVGIERYGIAAEPPTEE